MRLSETIRKKILQDNDFSIDIAKRLKVRQQVVLLRASRNSQLLLLPLCIEVYKEYGYSEGEIFSLEEPPEQGENSSSECVQKKGSHSQEASPKGNPQPAA